MSSLPSKVIPKTVEARADPKVLIGYAREEDIRALFELLGMLAKADRQVVDQEIKEVERFIASQVPLSHRDYAILCFRKGKEIPIVQGTVTARAFHLYGFRSDREAERWLEPLQVIDILLRIALVDGKFSLEESTLIEYARQTLGVHKRSYWILRDTIADMFGVAVAREGRSFKQNEPTESKNDTKVKRTSNQHLTRVVALKKLDLTEDATAEDIKNRHRALVRKYHPDLVMSQGSDEAIKESALRFCEIQQAYESLS